MGKYYSEKKLKQNINDINFIISKSGYGRYVEELENRIDKAIDYLKSDNYWVSQVKANDYLLDILKGSDSNE